MFRSTSAQMIGTAALLLVLATGVTHAQNDSNIVLLDFTTGNLLNSTNSTGAVETPSSAPSTAFSNMTSTSTSAPSTAFITNMTSPSTGPVAEMEPDLAALSAPSNSSSSTPTLTPSAFPATGGDDAADEVVDTPTVAPFPTIALPPQAPQSRAPTNSSNFVDMASETPSAAPSFTAQCSAFPSCANLKGDCCPSVDGVFLECCGLASVEETCSSNTKCAVEWGLLSGSCCPTLSGEFLDCCETVPNECLDDSGNCTVLSTRAYVESATAPIPLAFHGVLVVTLGLVVALMA